jgi:Divergent InlB B-repeat domain
MTNIILKIKNFINKGPAPYRRHRPSGSGFVLLFAVTLAAIFLSIALGVASVALREINFSTSAKDTNDAFFAADSGIEQALYNDKTSGFYPDNSKESFIVPNLGNASQGCAYVTVDKLASPSVIITANGYNIGNGSCNSTNPNRVERELATTYSGVTNYTVTGQVSGGNGSISPASQNISSGSPATLTASPSTGYSTSFSSTCGGTQSVNSFTISSVTAPCTVTASFSLNTYTVTATSGSNGTISSGGSVAPPSFTKTVSSGQTTTFTVTPNSSYTASVSGCGGSLSGTTYTTGTITSDCTVTASFSLNTYTVTATSGSNGTISSGGSVAPPSFTKTVSSGQTTTFTVTPNSNYTASTSGCGGSPTSSQSSAYTYTTGAITANCPVTASFSAIVEETPLKTAYGSPSSNINYSAGINAGYKFTPNFNGKIIKLGFNSLDTVSHTVYLYDYPAGNVLASVSGSSASSGWVYLSITPVSVTANHQYVVSSYGPTYGQLNQMGSFPVTPSPGDISINGAYYNASGSTSMPTVSTYYIYGWADIDFQKQ